MFQTLTFKPSKSQIQEPYFRTGLQVRSTKTKRNIGKGEIQYDRRWQRSSIFFNFSKMWHRKKNHVYKEILFKKRALHACSQTSERVLVRCQFIYIYLCFFLSRSHQNVSLEQLKPEYSPQSTLLYIKIRTKGRCNAGVHLYTGCFNINAKNVWE